MTLEEVIACIRKNSDHHDPMHWDLWRNTVGEWTFAVELGEDQEPDENDESDEDDD